MNTVPFSTGYPWIVLAALSRGAVALEKIPRQRRDTSSAARHSLRHALGDVGNGGLSQDFFLLYQGGSLSKSVPTAADFPELTSSRLLFVLHCNSKSITAQTSKKERQREHVTCTVCTVQFHIRASIISSEQALR